MHLKGKENRQWKMTLILHVFIMHQKGWGKTQNVKSS